MLTLREVLHDKNLLYSLGYVLLQGLLVVRLGRGHMVLVQTDLILVSTIVVLWGTTIQKKILIDNFIFSI